MNTSSRTRPQSRPTRTLEHAREFCPSEHEVDRIADAFGLDQEDQATLAKADETDLERWAALPLAVAIPRPDLLSMLHGSKPLRLATFHPLIIQP